MKRVPVLLHRKVRNFTNNTFTIVAFQCSLLNPFYSLFVVLLPILEKNSISSVAKEKTRSEVFLEQPVYAHWFALSLYNLKCHIQKQIKNGREVLTGDFHGYTYEIQVSFLKDRSQTVQFACSSECFPLSSHGLSSNTDLLSCEMTFSSLYSATLSDLCSKDSATSIVHQGPVRKKPRTSSNPETADILGFQRSTTSGRPGKTVCVRSERNGY